MKKVEMLFKIALLMPAFAVNTIYSQIVINSGPEVTPEEMVECILEDGMMYDNITFQGAPISRGIFSNGQTTNLGLDGGIFLTSGAGYIIPGPNNSTSAGVNNGMPGDATLNTITTSTTYDASVLEFDVIPASDTIRFTYVFGAEEYYQVGSQFNDVFGFFVSGPKPTGGNYANHNIGFIPDIEDFIVNTGQTLQYDLFTIVMTGKLAVIGAEEYHIKIGIADCGDGIVDSGVFIAENSIYSGKHIDVTEVLSPPGLTAHMVEGHVEADLIFHLQNTYFTPVTVYYSIEGDAINGSDYEEIDDEIYFAEGQDSAILHLTPIQDGVIEGDETIRLIIFNTLGGTMVFDTVEVIIEDYIEMYSEISPETTVCSGQEVELWVDVNNGFPPYAYNWQPGSYTNDTIMVSPEETTIYTVTYQDIFGESGSNSTIVTVLPDNLNDIVSFSFETENNPFLPEDIQSEILNDSVFLILPTGFGIDNLIATFIISNCAEAFVNGIEQISNVTANDFTNPVTFQVVAQNGDIKEWVVNVGIETGLNEIPKDWFSIFPNPSDGKFYLDALSSSNDLIELQVMDLTGRIVYEIQHAISERYEIDLSGQQKGMYFLRVKAGKVVANRKMIVQ
jgi:hypothetical protein